jgi:hypothetical protein
MKQTLALAVGAAAIIAITFGAVNLRADNDHKTKVCHVTGNGTNHVIEIDNHAVQTHLNHGDTVLDTTQKDLRPGEPCVLITPPPTSDPVLK